MVRVYGMSSSGNCYKIRLLLEQLRQPYDWVEIDTGTGRTRQPEFLARNPNGRVPVLEYEPGRFLAESNAILFYLAQESQFWPSERLHRAEALQWMFFEQYSHEPYIAVARRICTVLPPDHPRQAELPHLRTQGYQALDVMEQHLAKRPYFVADRYSIADIALYAYTHVAAEGGFELQRYRQVCAWIARIQQQSGYLSMAAA